MKVYMIKASAPGPFKEYKKYMGAPPQNIFSLAASTPKGVKIDMCDETAGMKPKTRTDAEIVVLMFHTPDAPHAYRMADDYRKKGKTVVLGGLHPTFEPDEAAEHADALLIGETEDIWTQLLKDYKQGKLQKRYERTEPVDMSTLNPYPTDIIKPSVYSGVWSVLVSRGCVHRCEYCVIPPFFKGKYRLRPVKNVVAEIKAAPAKWFELHADNLTADREYAVELFKALIPLNISWVGESTIKMADDEELLTLAAESGCKYLLIGIETPSKAALEKSGKGFVSPKETRDRIRKFHEHGIVITSSMMFGLDGQTKDIFQESLDFCNEIEIDEISSVILSPFAGTPLYKRMKEEGRLLTDDWALYDCSNAVFQPSDMTPVELDEGATWFWKKIQKRKPPKIKSGGKKKPATGTIPTTSGTPTAVVAGGINPGFKWKTLMALALIATAVWTGHYWLWGILFTYWVIKDIKEGRVYLVEDVPRSQNPILYWVIVTMWALFAIWTFSTAPLVQDYLAKYAEPQLAEVVVEPMPLVKQTVVEGVEDEPSVPSVSGKVAPPPGKKPKPVAKRKIQEFKTVSEASFGMRIVIPANWKAQNMPIGGGRQIDMEAPSGHAALTCVGMDLGTRMRDDQFVRMMEKELGSDLPFVKVGSGRLTTLAGKEDLQFREYTGQMNGQPLKAVVGFGLKRTKGYLLVGVFAPSDSKNEAVVLKSLESFSLDS